MTHLKTSFFAVIAAAVSVLLAACDVGEANTETPMATPLPVEVALPARVDIAATYQTTSTLSSDAEASVPTRVAGEVVEILVEEGDPVTQGQPLARLDGERLRLRMLQAKANLDKVSNEYERFVRLHEKGLVSANAFDGLRFDMESLEAAYRLQRLNYEYTTIRAPISGVVSAREIKVGQQIEVNEPVFKITDTEKLVAFLKIPQTELPKFSAGHTLKLRVDAVPDMSFDASIARISPTIDQRNGTFRATAYIDNASDWLAPGMFGRFEVAYETHLAVLTIPAAAIVSEDHQTVIYVVEDGAAVRRVIQTGIRSGEAIEVTDGLEGDEQVVVTGQGSLRDGSRVFASVGANKAIRG